MHTPPIPGRRNEEGVPGDPAAMHDFQVLVHLSHLPIGLRVEDQRQIRGGPYQLAEFSSEGGWKLCTCQRPRPGATCGGRTHIVSAAWTSPWLKAAFEGDKVPHSR